MSVFDCPATLGGAVTWRNRARLVIEQVLQGVAENDPDKLWAILNDAYPFGERKHTPWKVWKEEVKKVIDNVSS